MRNFVNDIKKKGQAEQNRLRKLTQDSDLKKESLSEKKEIKRRKPSLCFFLSAACSLPGNLSEVEATLVLQRKVPRGGGGRRGRFRPLPLPSPRSVRNTQIRVSFLSFHPVRICMLKEITYTMRKLHRVILNKQKHVIQRNLFTVYFVILM